MGKQQQDDAGPQRAGESRQDYIDRNTKAPAKPKPIPTSPPVQSAPKAPPPKPVVSPAAQKELEAAQGRTAKSREVKPPSGLKKGTPPINPEPRVQKPVEEPVVDPFAPTKRRRMGGDS